MPPLQPLTSTATVVDTQQGQLNQIVGKMADDLGTQNDTTLTALEAIRDAILAKPSA
jgi:hypothetical protein